MNNIHRFSLLICFFCLITSSVLALKNHVHLNNLYSIRANLYQLVIDHELLVSEVLKIHSEITIQYDSLTFILSAQQKLINKVIDKSRPYNLMPDSQITVSNKLTDYIFTINNFKSTHAIYRNSLAYSLSYIDQPNIDPSFKIEFLNFILTPSDETQLLLSKKLSNLEKSLLNNSQINNEAIFIKHAKHVLNYRLKTDKIILQLFNLNFHDVSQNLIFKKIPQLVKIYNQKRTLYIVTLAIFSLGITIYTFFVLVRLTLVNNKLNSSLKIIAESEISNKKLASIDPLTGLENRRQFNDNFEKCVHSLLRYNDTYALLTLDLDDFKEINDNYGHDAGDVVLKVVAARLKDIIRKEDYVARLGGDEFAILVRNETGNLSILANKILSNLTAPILYKEVKLNISCSIGISMLGDDSHTVEQAFKHADLALYKSKDEGRNTYSFFSKKLEIAANKKFSTLEELKKAIADDALELFYQPQYAYKKNKFTSLEALIRWPLGNGDYIYPDEFIPLAEENGLMLELGDWILNRACHDIKQINQKFTDIQVAINLSAKQFDNPNLVSNISSYVEKYGIDKNKITLEVTETTLMQNIDKSIALLNTLKEEGFDIALDDFGTGYSSMFYLQKLPIASIKIDKAFVSQLPHCTKSCAIVDTTILLAHWLNLDVTAEGIETQEQADYIEASKCKKGQGYFYAYPQPLSQVLQTFHDL